jgi:hypothetical protein
VRTIPRHVQVEFCLRRVQPQVRLYGAAFASHLRELYRRIKHKSTRKFVPYGAIRTLHIFLYEFHASSCVEDASLTPLLCLLEELGIILPLRNFLSNAKQPYPSRSFRNPRCQHHQQSLTQNNGLVLQP